MKKTAFFLLALMCVMLTACKKNAESGEVTDTIYDETDEFFAYNTEEFQGKWAGAIAVNAAFDLDYTPQQPETDNEAESLDLRRTAGGGSQVVGGGLRKLQDYATRYLDAGKERGRIAAIQSAYLAAAALADSVPEPREGDFVVVDWGPQGDYSAANARPALYIAFSRPVTTLAALGIEQTKSDILTITPPVKGVFRWYGTSMLAFEGSEPLLPMRRYTMTLSPKTKSIYGETITGEREFSFETEELRLLSIEPGVQFKKDNPRLYFSSDEVPPAAAKSITLNFNYPVRASALTDFIKVTSNGKDYSFKLKDDKNNSLLCEVSEEIGFEKEVYVHLLNGASGEKDKEGTMRKTRGAQYKSFNTPGVFRVNRIQRAMSYGRYNNIVDIDFSMRINESTVKPEMFSTDPPMTITKDNIEVFYNSARLYNLPVSYGDKFTVTVKTGIKDIYGRNLSGEFLSWVTVPDRPPPEGQVTFLPTQSITMLEAAYPRYLFNYKNVAEGSYYSLARSANPLSSIVSDAKRFDIESPEIDYKYFADFDLSPFLNNGRGFVQFDADVKLLPKADKMFSDGTWYYSRTDSTMIQVTDLGLTVRYGFNKAAVLVTNISTGQPVEGAEVRLLSPALAEESAVLSETPAFASAKTDASGLAVLALEAGVYRENSRDSRNYISAPYVYAEKDGDSAVFRPSSHSSWRFGVSGGNPSNAEQEKPVAFLFTDRGLYKPGETLTFRGIDRSLVLGKYEVFNGDYTLTLEEDRYNGERVTVIEGTTSRSGGLWGTIDLPDTTTPGSYRLVYKRQGMNTNIANVPVTIAYFERLKFQASVSAASQTVISGGNLNAALSASYLSGGSLSGASFEANWYRNISYFHPGTAETRGWTFGPRRTGDGERFISSENGQLSADGSAALALKTGGESVKGAPYLYRVEASVTDISNQMAAASMSTLVHPALFYIGLRREGGSGFVKAGAETEFGFLAVSAQGEAVKDSGIYWQNGQEARTANVSLYREEWRRSQQAGVNGYVYNQYVRTEIQDDISRTIKLDTGTGKFKVKPSGAGYHILRVTSKDRDGRETLTEVTFYATGRAGGYWNSDNAQEIRLTPEEGEYNPGDTAQVLLQSELPAGNYLITLEREGIYTEEVRYLDGSSAVLEIPIARNFVPVVYLAVSSYSTRSGAPAHEYGSPDLDKPKGYFGVTPIMVNPLVRSFSIAVDAGKKSFRPGEEVSMTLTATQGGEPLSNAEITVMAVDRGVLDLIDYHVSDPISYFYSRGRFPLYAVGGDSRALLMDPVTYSVKNLQGGDSDDSKLDIRSDFNPTAFFEPALITDSQGKAVVKFKLPDTLTTYRITAFGVHDEDFALKESELVAQNLINVREVLPRRLRERDTAEAGVLITNLDDKAHTVKVSLKTAPPRPSTEDDGRLKPAGLAIVDGASERSATVASGGNAVLYFDIAAVKAGFISLEWTTNSSILNERLVNEVQIEKPFIMETVTTTGSVSQGREAQEALVIPSYAEGGQGSLSVTLDATRLAELDAAISYLFHYPYGCMEQRSAAILPLVIFGDYLDALSLKSEVSDPRKVIEKELREWAKVQLPTGGFPYWPSGHAADSYVSLRIAQILAIAKDKGIAVPKALDVDKLLGYLENEYREWMRWTNRSAYYYYRNYNSAWALYVFALHGRAVDASRLNSIITNNDAGASDLALAGLAALKIGRKSDADAAAAKLRALLRPDTRGVEITDPARAPSYYNTGTEQLALTLELLVQMEPKSGMITRLLYSLIQNKKAGYWESTATTSRVLSAVDALIKAENVESTNINARVTLMAAALMSGSFRGLGAKPVQAARTFDEPPLAAAARDKMMPLVFTASGTGTVYYTAELRYAIPEELQIARDEGLSVYASLTNPSTGEIVSGTALKAGAVYRMRVKLTSTRRRTYTALRVPIPSGAEILDAAFLTTPSTPGGNEDGAAPSVRWRGASHQSIYDNEVQYFFDTLYSGETEVSFLFRAARRGVYPTPPVTAECMYQPEIFGRTSGVLWTIE